MRKKGKKDEIIDHVFVLLILCLPAYGFYAAVVYSVAAFLPSTNQDLLLSNACCIFLSNLFKLGIFLLY